LPVATRSTDAHCSDRESSNGQLRTDPVRIAIATAFFAIGLLQLDDYGLTWDESESYQAGGLALFNMKAVVRGRPLQSWNIHQLPGYSFVVDVLGSGFVRVVSRDLHLMDWVVAFHLFHLLLSTLALYLVYGLAHEVSGRRRIATIATIALAVLPQFVGHAQNNPKDLPGLLALVLALSTFVRLDAASTVRSVLIAAIATGVALTTHVSALLLVPLFGIWHAVSRRWLAFRSYVVFAVAAIATAVLTWPWLWSAPYDRISWAVGHVSERFGFGTFPVLYLGRVYQAWELPWHYSLVCLLVATPVLYVATMLCSIGRLRVRRTPSAGTAEAAAVLGWSWCAIMIVAESVAPMRYDGARHLLIIAPAMCLLAAVGFDLILEWITRAPWVARSGVRARALALTCAVAAFTLVVVQDVQVHPYQNAYLNEVANAWISGHAEDTFEIEYWGQPFKEGSDWINRHAEPDAAVFVSIGDEAPMHYLKRRFVFLDDGTLPLFENQTRPAYVMLITRKAFYGGAVTSVMHRYEPVFEVRRQKGTLLAIYSNRRSASPSTN